MILNKHEEFIKKVKEQVGDEYTFKGEYRYAREKIPVIHNKCGHCYSVTPDNFLRGNRCPHCKASKGEHKIMKYLENNSFDYDTQVVFKDLKDNHPLRFDFSIKTPNNFILLEYDGIQHFEPVKHWGGEEGLRRNQLRDKMKNDYVREKGYKLIRIPYWEFDNIEEILNEELKGDL